MGRPGGTCYVLILYFSYLEPYILFQFLYSFVYCRALIKDADECLMITVVERSAINMIINHDRQPLSERVE